MSNINFDSNQMERDFIELYKSGKLPFEKFDEYTKGLVETTHQMLKTEEEEETKRVISNNQVKQLSSNNMAKNIENFSKASIEWSTTLRPILTAALLLFEGGKEIYHQMCKKPEKNTNNPEENAK